jgi:hypothetical protein
MKALLTLLALLWATSALAQTCTIGPSNPGTLTQLQVSSSGTTGAVSATLPASASRWTYLCGWMVTSAGATAGTVRAGVITGIAGTYGFTYLDPSSGQGFLGAALPICISSSAVNTGIVVTVPGGGTGTVGLTVTAWGCNQ